MLEIATKVIGWIIHVLPIFIIVRPRPRTYASTSPLLLLQLHQQQQLLSINIIKSTNHHLQHAKLRILLQHLTSHAAYERRGGPPKRPTAKRPCIYIFMFGWLYQPTCSFVIGIYFYVWYTTCCPKWEEALEFTYMVIGEVLVLGLLVVVYKIPYNSCMWTRQDVIGVFQSYYCLSGTSKYNVCARHSPVYHYIASTAVYLVQ